jgi:phosphoenolpyruvate-protein kinase (PTS system EI component)
LNFKADGMRGRPAVTAKGRAVKTMINVDSPSVLNNIDVNHCDGIGLFRTEFLIEGDNVPDEGSQFTIYRKVVAWAQGRPSLFAPLMQAATNRYRACRRHTNPIRFWVCAECGYP